MVSSIVVSSRAAVRAGPTLRITEPVILPMEDPAINNAIRRLRARVSCSLPDVKIHNRTRRPCADLNQPIDFPAFAISDPGNEDACKHCTIAFFI